MIAILSFPAAAALAPCRALAAAALVAFATLAHADKALPVVTIKVAGHALRVEVVATDQARTKGLMFREKLARDGGMLFVYDDPGYHAMWMMNTLIPLSVAFLDGEGRILNIADMEPKTTDTHMAAGPAHYAIETNKGWFAARKIKPGDKVTGLPAPKK